MRFSCRHFVATALERTMRLSFREFHLQFDPTLRRERVPEAMFELLGPTPSARPVFEGPPETASANPEAPVAMDAAEPQPNGKAPDAADAAAQAPDAAVQAPDAAADPSAQAPDAADAPAQAAAEANADAAAPPPEQGDELEPVPAMAQELFTQVPSFMCCRVRHGNQNIPCLVAFASTACYLHCTAY